VGEGFASLLLAFWKMVVLVSAISLYAGWRIKQTPLCYEDVQNSIPSPLATYQSASCVYSTLNSTVSQANAFSCHVKGRHRARPALLRTSARQSIRWTDSCSVQLLQSVAYTVIVDSHSILDDGSHAQIAYPLLHHLQCPRNHIHCLGK
jgi:hypothetical protein